jgi:hypothetical protein
LYPEITDTAAGNREKVEKGVSNMILPITSNRIISVNGVKEAPVRPKPLDHNEPINDTVVISKIDVGTEKVNGIPRDQVGICDNLTASYWG